MRTTIVLSSSGSDARMIAETADRLAAEEMETIVVCTDAQRPEVSETAESDPRIAVDPVPGGGPVAAMRTGFRATRTHCAFVTTPGTPPLEADALPALSPDVDADATLARIDGSMRPPCGGYVVGPAREACDTTLAMGSRRVSDVLARLTTTTEAVESAPCPTAATGATATGTN